MLLRLQNTILEMIAKGESLTATTDRLCLEVEALVPGIICSVLTVDGNGLLHPLSSPSLPENYSSALDGVKIGPTVGSCGTAAFRRAPVAVIDIETDPLWAGYKALAHRLALTACWSSPICNGESRVLGTFAFYYREKRGPSTLEQEIVATCVHLCAIAIEHLAFGCRRSSDDLSGTAFLSTVWDRLAKSSRNFASNASWIAFCN